MAEARGRTERRREAATSEALHVQLLGGFQVTVGSRVIPADAWRLRKAAGLLKLLALAEGYRLHREQLLDVLWPELDPAAGSNNLHYALHAARRVLDPEGQVPGGYLRLVGEQVVLAPEGELAVDVTAFDTSASRARRTGSRAEYELAVRLYGGELLPEDLYEDWAAARRESLRQTYLGLCLELAGLQEEVGRLAPAIEVLQRAVHEEPVCEEAHAGLMRLYARSGYRSQALRQYEELQETLERELGTGPSEETEALHAAIQAGEVPGPEATAPALAGSPAPGVQRHNLPASISSFIGREAEAARARGMLDESRLLTLTGAGGTGKTRLAIEVAGEVLERYRDGVWLVQLAPVSDPALVPQAVAAELGVKGQADTPLVETLHQTLTEKSLLLVLDNCEHLVVSCAELAEGLLATCPHVQILATSREPLRIAGELTWRVPSLSVPQGGRSPTVEEMSGCEAVQLLVERVRFRQPDFVLTETNAAAVAQITRRVEGIPLAIELAAARVGTLSVGQIAARLDDSLSLLTGGSRTAGSRQQTLRGALDWSYRLLVEEEQRLFCRLAVFAGGWTLEAAQVVGTAEGHAAGDVLEGLSRLVDQSLVVAEMGLDGGMRYRMLEPIRQYAHARLIERGEADAIHRRHAVLLLQLAEAAEPELAGPRQGEWLDRLQAEIDNTRAALVWTRGEFGDAELGLKLATRLSRLLMHRGDIREVGGWLAEMLARAPGADPALQARARQRAGILAMQVGDASSASANLEEALALFRSQRDETSVAWTLAYLSNLMRNTGDAARQRDLTQQFMAIARQVGDKRLIAIGVGDLAQFADREGDHERARDLREESLAIDREVGNLVGIGLGTYNLAAAERKLGNYQRALELIGQALSQFHALGEKRLMTVALDGFAFMAHLLKQDERAVRLYATANRLRHESGYVPDAPFLEEVNRCIGEARETLGDALFEAAWETGSRMSLDEALQYALDYDRSPIAPDGLPAPERDPGPLTPREAEIASLVGRGLTNRQIGGELGLSVRTVDTHVGRILKKLGLSSRSAVASWASARGEPR